MARELKHVGKMKNNGAKVVVAYRTLPGDANSALVIGTGTLSDTWHDTIMSIVQDVSGQQANELADILAVRKFPDGENILVSLHKRGLLKKVPTNGVIMTPSGNSSIPLNELNQIIADQKGVEVEDLAVSDGTAPKRNKSVKDDPTRTTSSSVNAGEDIVAERPVVTESKSPTLELTPAEMRSRADALFKQAQVLRKQADEMDPPKSKKKKEVVTDAE